LNLNDLASAIAANVTAALAEDVGSGDWTARLVPADRQAQATVICRAPTVVCGRPWFDTCIKTLDPHAEIIWNVVEGDFVPARTTLCTLRGVARGLLTAERTALNFLQMLCAVATVTRRYVEAAAGTHAKIVDTRKTLPGLRLAQKYAVRTGGGFNHRTGLFDGMLIKENHIVAAGGIAQALREAASIAPQSVWVQIEVENLIQLREALDAGAKMILLDNMRPAKLRAAVAITAGRAELEASGGISMRNVRAIAAAGVDRISIGSLTKDIKAADLSMRFAELK
jgi:nicotinate-nucleotide pyrophosphorylase (carboxylating)